MRKYDSIFSEKSIQKSIKDSYNENIIKKMHKPSNGLAMMCNGA